jgi:hypothetical protein
LCLHGLRHERMAQTGLGIARDNSAAKRIAFEQKGAVAVADAQPDVGAGDIDPIALRIVADQPDRPALAEHETNGFRPSLAANDWRYFHGIFIGERSSIMNDKPEKPTLTVVHASIKSRGAAALGRRAVRGTAGKRVFVEGGDGRSPWSIRWKDLIYSHATDLGGVEVLSEAQISVIRRASAIECELERLEADMSVDGDVDLDQYGRLAGRLCRLFELVGIKRLARPIDPTSDLAKALEAYPLTAIDDDDDDEPVPIEAGFDKSEPGEA